MSSILEQFRKYKNVNPVNVPIRNHFLTCLALGTFGIIIGWKLHVGYISVFSPLLMMGIYVVLGLRNTHVSFASDNFADSIYFLGFLFTLIAFAISIYDLEQGHDISGLISRFGIALTTTIVGLFFRIYIINFHDDITDSKKVAEEVLAKEVDRFKQDLELVNDKLRLVSNQFEENARLMHNSLNDHMESSSTFMMEVNEKIAGSLIAAIEQTTQKFSESSENSAKYLKEGLEQMVSRMSLATESFNERLLNINYPEDLFTNKLEKPINNLSSSMNDYNKLLSESVSEQRKIKDNTRNVATSMDNLVKKYQTFSQLISEVEDTFSPLLQVDFNVKQVNNTFKKLEENITSTQHTFDAIAHMNIDSENINKNIKQLNQKLEVFHENITPITSLYSDGEKLQAVVLSLNDTMTKLDESLSPLVNINFDPNMFNQNMNEFNHVVENTLKKLQEQMGTLGAMREQAEDDLKYIKEYREQMNSEVSIAKENFSTIYLQLVEAADFVHKKLKN